MGQLDMCTERRRAIEMGDIMISFIASIFQLGMCTIKRRNGHGLQNDPCECARMIHHVD